jgi:hypothetical protein
MDVPVLATDWRRAEDLFKAFASRVGAPGCTPLWPHQASAILRLRAFAEGARRMRRARFSANAGSP